MKKYILIAPLIAAMLTSYAQVKIGQQATGIAINTLLNAPVKSAGVELLKGKVILLEFWATWCGPCVEAMPHLQELQKAYNGKLQIIAVSSEKEKRIKRFLANCPSNLWFAIDTANLLDSKFPHSTIPHAVLIDQKGVVIAITQPENITNKVIAGVIAGKSINLPLKNDIITADPWQTYFPADKTTGSRFLIQPEIKGLGGSSKLYQQDSVFKGRRLTMINLPLETIYRIAYGNLPYGRTIDLTPKGVVKEGKQNYCLDIIVPQGQESELFTILQKELKTRFELQATVEKRIKPVYMLTIADPGKIAMLEKSAVGEKDFAGGRGTFSGESVRLYSIADYLESFGLADKPVIDETGNNDLYNISFTFMAEKKGDLKNALSNLGLKLTEGAKEIDMLIFR